MAQLTALTANLNRDSKKTPKAFGLRDFCLFSSDKDGGDLFPADAAAVALQLRHQGECPAALIGCWDAVVEVAGQATSIPKVRVLWNENRSVAVLAPQWEGRNIRGTLVVSDQVSGDVLLRDPDRPLLSYWVKLPHRPLMGYVSAGELVLAGS